MPSPASMMPAFTSSSLYLPISASSFGSGSLPASESLFAFTITMTRIVVLLVRGLGRRGHLPKPLGLEPCLYQTIERPGARSTRPIDFSQDHANRGESFAFFEVFVSLVR